MRPALLILALGLPGAAMAQSRSALYVPPSTWAAEDMAVGDEDHNDFALDYNARCVVDDATLDLVSEEIRFVPRTAGAAKTNTLLLRFDGQPRHIDISTDGGATFSVACNDDCNPDTVLYWDLRDAFTPRGTGFVNTEGPIAFAGKAHVLRIEYPAGTPAPTVGGAPTCPLPEFALMRGELALPIDSAATAPGNHQPLVGHFAHYCPTGSTCPPDALVPFSVPTERTSIATAYGSGFMSWLTDLVQNQCEPGTCAAEDWYQHPGVDVVDGAALAATQPLDDAPTCDDSVQNADETGIDCGGDVCGPCLPIRVNVDWTGAVVGGGNQPSLSNGATRVAFGTGYNRPGLVPGHFNLWGDIYVRDLATGQTILVTVPSSGTAADFGSGFASISADGRYVAYQSGASNLVPGDTNGKSDIFVRDLQTGTTEMVSVSSSGALGDGDSERPSISGDGRYVVFSTRATNLAGTDGNGVADDILRHDRQTGETVRVNVSSTGVQGDTGYRTRPAISSDGRYVAFESNATNLVPGDTNGTIDVFRRDMVDGTTIRVSLYNNGDQAWSNCMDTAMSGDGQHVAFRSSAPLALGANGSTYHVFVRDVAAGTTTLASVATSGEAGNDTSQNPSLSYDGRYVAFQSPSSNLGTPAAPGFQQNIYVRDLVDGTTRRITMGYNGAQPVPEGWSGGNSWYAALAPDGSAVGFQATFSNLVPGDAYVGDGNYDLDAFVVFLP